MSDWLIHVGYPKCGSTWMQLKLFPSLPGIDFLGKRFRHKESNWFDEVRDAVTKKHSFEFSSEEVHQIIGRNAGVAKLPRLLSNEDFTGDLWRGAHNNKQTADRLKQTFPDASILMVVRRQVQHLESLYKQYLLVGGTMKVPQFLESNSHHLRFDLKSLCYDRLADYYIQCFGSKKVLVLPFELLVANAQLFSDKVCDFFAVDHVPLDLTAREHVRRGYSARQCALVRPLNMLRKSTFNPLGFYVMPTRTTNSKLGPFNPYLLANAFARIWEKAAGEGDLFDPAEKRRLERFYSSSNERLVSLFPGLADYGYGRLIEQNS